MRFNRHSSIAGQHAVLSASKYQWINYDLEKMERVFVSAMAAQRGTELHAFAHEAIRLGIKLPDSTKTLNSYVNDAIGYGMSPELVLYYSDNCFGTPDAISFRDDILRIHDLKTGVTPASVKQLLVYVALFCLEYKYKPFEIQTSLKIYQNDDVQEYVADPDEIIHIMEKMKMFDRRLNELRMEALG